MAASAPPTRRRGCARYRFSCGSSSERQQKVVPRGRADRPPLRLRDTISPLKRIASIPVVVLAALVACSSGKPPSQAPAPAVRSVRLQADVPYKISLSYDDARAVLDAHQADLPASLR